MKSNFYFKTYDIILSALFIALIIVGAFIKIPIGPVPITLQFMFVLFAGQLLNWHTAGLTLILYTVLGLIGLPVFSGGGGLSYVLTPTFGYIIGFIFAAVVVSVISHNGKQCFAIFLLANFVGFLAVYICGLGYYIMLSLFYFGQVIDLGALMLTGFIVFIPTDIAFCIFTAIISKRIKPVLVKKRA